MLEQAVSQQHGERDELIGHLNQIKEDHTSANQNTESMVGKIQVREGMIQEPLYKGFLDGSVLTSLLFISHLFFLLK